MSGAVRHTLIKASAGSGKTFRLSTRFLTLLALDEAPEHILATTFTRKAAAEILTRIFKRLARGAANDKAAALLGSELSVERLTSARCRELLQRLVRSQHRLNICTMDSFCVKVARAFSLELGFSSAWEILDEDQDRRIREEALQRVLSADDPDELAALTRLAQNDGLARSVHRNLLSQLNSAYAMYGDSSEAAWGNMTANSTLNSEELAALVDALATHSVPQKQDGAPDTRWLGARDKTVASVIAGNWAKIFDEGIAAKVAAGDLRFYSAAIPDELCALYTALLKHASGVLLGRACAASRALFQLLQRFDVAYRERKRSAAAMRFADVKRALGEAALLQDLTPLYFRLDGQIHHLLLDEFQDTSGEEWRVILPLAEEVLSQGEDRRSFFCVGDMKQAIYGWRGGVAEIFDEVERRFEPVLERIPLDQSRRSAPQIIDFVNLVFGSLVQNEALTAYAAVTDAWQKRFTSHTTFQASRSGYVEYRAVSATSADEADVALYHETASLVHSLLQRSPGLEIGVLVRTNKVAAQVRYELQKAPYLLVVREEGGTPVVDSPAVNLALSLLTLSDHPGDAVARFHVASSPLAVDLEFPSFSDHQRADAIARHVRSRLVSDGYGATLRWIEDLLAPHCDRRDQERLGQLTELALQYEPRATLRAEDFVRFVSGARRESGAESSVRVLTIHQAKGLEFDAVVLPELGGRLAGNAQGPRMLYDRSTPLAPFEIVLRAPPAAVVQYDERLRAMRARMDMATVSESLSVLYVALTRPRYALYMLTLPEKEGKESHLKATFDGVLRSACAVGKAATPGAVLYQTGDPEWLKDLESSQVKVSAPTASSPELRLRPSAKRTRMLPRKSPSGLEGAGSVPIDLLFRAEGDAARHHGTLLHLFFEQVRWSEDQAPERAALLKFAHAAEVSEAQALPLIDEFLAMCADPAVSSLLSKSRYSWPEVEVWRERRFALRDGEHLLTGSFDRVVIGRKGTEILGAEIIDFKSDIVEMNNLSAKIDYYRPQLEAYRASLVSLLGAPSERIKLTLVFLRARKVVEL